MKQQEIKKYPIEKFEAHPNNPRKDLGDLTELSDSIRQLGVLQNLIVVINGDKLRVVAGHRRLEAAKLAEVKELPAAISELSEKEQLEIMLLENLQRENLTLTEQADGFQLLIDLGSSVEEICQETGFSERSVYYRLNIAKLNKKSIEKAEKKLGDQMRLSDFIALEKVENVKTRNKLLSEYGGRRDFDYYIEEEVKREKRIKNVKELEKKAKEAGLEEGAWVSSWDSGITNYKSSFYEEIKKIPKGVKYYSIDKSGERIIFYSKEKKKKGDLSPQEKKEKEERQKKNEARSTIQNIEEQITEALKSYIWYLYQNAEEQEKKDEVLYYIIRFIAEEYTHYGTTEAFEEKKPKTVEEVLEIMLAESMDSLNWFDNWDCAPREQEGAQKELFEYAIKEGLVLDAECVNALAGTHPMQKVFETLRK